MTFANKIKIINTKIENSNKLLNKVDITQLYTLLKTENPAYNEKINDNSYRIEISLATLMLRKNMAFKKIWKKVDYYFILEFLCVLLQDQGLWSEHLCNNGSICKIQKIMMLMNNLSKL